MIALFTDFGTRDPYVGQVHAVLAGLAPGIPLIDLFHHVPRFAVQAAAYLLPAYVSGFPRETVFICVVDPGVGSARKPLALHVDGNWFVGPDNGLFEMLMRRAEQVRCHEIMWRPDTLSDSFHGRDLFAPVAARLATGKSVDLAPCLPSRPNTSWPDDLQQLVYIDHYGNGITGLRGSALPDTAWVRLGQHRIAYGRVFSEFEPATPFWYRNSNDLLEIAVREDSAARYCGFAEGDAFRIEY